jgi:trigger factor
LSRNGPAEDGHGLKVSTEKIPDSQVLMTIEVEPERLEEARGKALRKLAPRAKVPGFRPGKAPPAMIQRYLGEERILDEALDALVPVVYREAVEADESIDPIARPQLVVEQTDPLIVKATIPVRPTVELGDYHAVRVKAEPVIVDEQRVDDTLTTLRRRAATLEPVERPVAWRDVVRVDIKGTIEDTQIVGEEDIEIQLTEERDLIFPGFEEGILGHTKGETVEFHVDLPDDPAFERFADKRAHFTVTLHETKEEVLPELDDEFASHVGEGFESVDALRQRVRDDIRAHEREQIDERYHDEILGELVERSNIEFPPVMLDVEVDRILHDQASRMQQGQGGVEQYLAALGRSEEEVRAELRPIADTRLRRSLALSEVAEQEKVEVADDDIEAEIDKLSGAAQGPQAEQVRQLFGSEGGRDTIRRNLLTRRTLDRLVEIATQDGAAEPTAEQEKPKKPRAKRARKTDKEKETAPAAEAESAEE